MKEHFSHSLFPAICPIVLINTCVELTNHCRVITILANEMQAGMQPTNWHHLLTLIDTDFSITIKAGATYVQTTLIPTQIS